MNWFKSFLKIEKAPAYSTSLFFQIFINSYAETKPEGRRKMRSSRLKWLKGIENDEQVLKVEGVRGGGEEANSTEEWACHKKGS
jgi:hypothetical protein